MGLFGLIVLSVLFAASHLLLSHGEVRSGLVEKLGVLPFRAVYSVVSLITLGGAIWLFVLHKGEGPLLWDAPGLTYLLAYPLILLALIMLFQAAVTPSPAGIVPGAMEVRGALRLTRHPMNMGIALFALAHLIGNGHLADVVFFGSLFVTGFAGAYHQDRRKARELGEPYAHFQIQTSIFPLLAVVDGRARLDRDEFNPALLAFSVGAFVVLALLHHWLFGVTPW